MPKYYLITLLLMVNTATTYGTFPKNPGRPLTRMFFFFVRTVETYRTGRLKALLHTITTLRGFGDNFKQGILHLDLN